MTSDVYSRLSKAYMDGMESAFLPEILELFLSEPEARFLLSLPGTIDDVASKLGEERAAVTKTLEEFYKRGFVLRKESTDGMVYALVNDLLDFLLHDKLVFDRLSDAGLKNHFLDLCNELFEKELSQHPSLSELAVPRARVIPVEKMIPMKWGEVLPLEKISTVLESATVIAQTECTCRVMARNCDNPTDVCIIFNDFANIFIDRGVAQKITKEEAISILEKCEELGLVHSLNNSDSTGLEFLCNCCTCCCMVLRGMALMGKEDICFKSRYLSKPNSEKCTACGICVDRCQFDAISIKNDKAIIDEDKCFGCGLCASGCPEEAIELVCVRDHAHITDNLSEEPDNQIETLMIMKKLP
ncbi:MAG: 4Fe-4S binding protein [Methanobacteriota archaeon]|nr:MAG: 4Fe-4S binding protein [Euryarchaeota archaeon]